MSASHSAVASLEYEKRRPFYRRRPFRRAFVSAIAAGLACVAWYFLPEWKDVTGAYWYHRCSGYAAPAGRVIYDDDPQTHLALLKSADYTAVAPAVRGGSPFALRENRVWQGLGSSMGAPRLAPAAFVHARTSPGGRERLVVIHFGVFPDPVLHRIGFGATLYADARTGIGFRHVVSQSSNLQLLRHATDRVRILDGRPDPNDASRFTIDVQVNGVTHTIDGQLDDPETVTLTPRASPHATTFNMIYWNPTGVPVPRGFLPAPPQTTQPATAPSATRPATIVN